MENQGINSDEETYFLHVHARKDYGFYSGVIVVAVLMIIGGILTLALASLLSLAFVLAGLILILASVSNMRKIPFRSVSVGHESVRIQDSKTAMRKALISEIQVAKLDTDQQVLIYLKSGRMWYVGFGWLSMEDMKKVVDSINAQIV